ncbi:MAG: MlaE family ABC transporter permease [Planctomycetota bacterium]
MPAIATATASAADSAFQATSATAQFASRTLTDLIFGRTGRFVMRRLQLAAELATLMMLVLKSVWLERGKARILIASTINKQIRFTGVDALPLISLLGAVMGLLSGLVIAALANASVTQSLAPRLQMIFLELLLTTAAPMIITLIVIARSGTAVSTELGTMRIRRELEVFDAIGANVYYVVVWPRIVGMIVALVCLTIYFNFMVVVVQFVLVGFVANVESVRAGAQLSGTVSIANLAQAVLKTGIIGLGIAVIACHFGLSARQSFTEIPQVATRGVVNGIIFSVLANLVVFWLFYLVFGFRFLQM